MLTKVCKNREKLLDLAVILFFLAQSVNGYFIQTTSGRLCDVISFGGVVASFAFVLLIFNKSIDWLLCALALMFTVVADWNLVMLAPMRELPAMYAFSVVQILYFIRIYNAHKKAPDDVGRGVNISRVHIAVRAMLVAAAMVACAVALGDGADLLSMIAMFYYANLVCNAIFACVEFRTMPAFAIGLVCFVFCDLFVGLGMLDQYVVIERGSLVYRLTHTDLNMAWVFYVPSYTLIAISARKRKI